ncbi:MAG: hypothetical protein LBS89_06705, partial [Zoogloeaceae bacterium]|nr:hypothetical protein [Zoogloeaceae bacterium]
GAGAACSGGSLEESLMDFEWSRLWIQLIPLAANGATWAWLYIEKRNDKTNERIDELTNRHEELDKSLREMKGNHLRSDDLQKLYDRLNGMDSRLSSLCGEFRQQSNNLNLILNKIAEKGLK